MQRSQHRPTLVWICAGLIVPAACQRDVEVWDDAWGASSTSEGTGGDHSTGGGADDAGDDNGGGDGGGDGEDDDGVKFDTPVPDSSAGGEDCGGGGLLFSYIWISNTPGGGQGKLSKLNTVTLVEEGRYFTHEDGDGNPSRTSVNLSGDVAVANRHGGITKFYARIEDCQETNGIPGIQTSTGKDDVLPWDQEECRAWHTPIGDGTRHTSNRPVAWTAGTFDEQSCSWTNQKVWTSTTTLDQPGSLQVLRLDGATGAIEDVVPAPDIEIGFFGAYGGAVDGEDNFWFSTRRLHTTGDGATLSRVRNDDLTLDTWPVPDEVWPYGMTFDGEGHAWVAGFKGGAARFDPETEQWDVVDSVLGLGMQADGEGRVWLGSYPSEFGGMGPGAIAIDVETLDVLDFIPIPVDVPTYHQTKGVSIDFHGYVWIVEQGSRAHRVDPDTHEITTYDGLNEAYTYSDMTGWGLANVAGVPQG